MHICMHICMHMYVHIYMHIKLEIRLLARPGQYQSASGLRNALKKLSFFKMSGRRRQCYTLTKCVDTECIFSKYRAAGGNASMCIILYAYCIHIFQHMLRNVENDGNL